MREQDLTETQQADEILTQLHALANPTNVQGMARFGINPENALGVSVTTLRQIARSYRNNHPLALNLWERGIHEARILASIIDDPAQVSETQMEKWVSDFNSWDLVDQCCLNLFGKTPFAFDKALEWSAREAEFICRAGFSQMAVIAVHHKQLSDDSFEPFFAAILSRCTDERNFVKKAVNWALRNIGKRSATLCDRAIEVAEQMKQIDSKAARWIAADALRELHQKKIKMYLLKK